MGDLIADLNRFLDPDWFFERNAEFERRLNALGIPSALKLESGWLFALARPGHAPDGTCAVEEIGRTSTFDEMLEFADKWRAETAYDAKVEAIRREVFR